MNDKQLTTREAANFLGFAPRTLINWRYWNKGPKYITYPDTRTIRYWLSDLEAYQQRTTTTEQK